MIEPVKEELYFEADGIVSFWVGQIRVVPGANFLRDLYGIDAYDPDNQECFVAESATLIEELVSQLSYSESFQSNLIEVARQRGITSAVWIMAQYDFAYDPAIVGLTTLPEEPVFLGKFLWHE